MNKLLIAFPLFFLSALFTEAQSNPNDYYYEIPDYPSSYSAENVVARMVDGLGFRYYWGSADLTESDLKFQPSDSARSTLETLEHIYVLTEILAKAVNEEAYSGVAIDGMSYNEIRTATLINIQQASEKLKSSNDGSLEKYEMIFKSSGSEYPFWNLLNGPIADAINHVGQVISLRRTNGNPYNQNLSILQGTVKK